MRRSGVRHLGRWLNRVRRSLGFDRNRLRRPIDRHQRTAALLLIALFLLTAPLTALRASGLAYDSGTQAERREAADRHQVTAKVLDVKEPAAETGVTSRLTVAWTEPDGSHRIGTTTTVQRVDPGELRRIWVDDASGTPTTRPQSHRRTVGDTAFAGTGAAVGIGAVLALGYRLLRHHCDRRRYRQWEADWAHLDRRRIS